ncbi:hypothetical protein MBLNU459_g7638t1 [Dothideomycetes sp. NU459]
MQNIEDFNMAPLYPSMRNFVGFSSISRKPLFQHQYIYWNEDSSHEHVTLVYEVDYRSPFPIYPWTRTPQPSSAESDPGRHKYLLTSGGLLKSKKKLRKPMDNSQFLSAYSSAYANRMEKASHLNSGFRPLHPNVEARVEQPHGLTLWECFLDWFDDFASRFWSTILILLLSTYAAHIFWRNQTRNAAGRDNHAPAGGVHVHYHGFSLTTLISNIILFVFRIPVVIYRTAIRLISIPADGLSSLAFMVLTWSNEIRYHPYRFALQNYIKFVFYIRFWTVVLAALFVLHMVKPPAPHDLNTIHIDIPAYVKGRKPHGSNSHYDPSEYQSAASSRYLQPEAAQYSGIGIAEAWMDDVAGRTGSSWDQELSESVLQEPIAHSVPDIADSSSQVGETTTVYVTVTASVFDFGQTKDHGASSSAPDTQSHDIQSGQPSSDELHIKTKRENIRRDTASRKKPETPLNERGGTAYCKKCRQYHCCEFPKE